ncbi:hypothetical protein L873DRAFT_1790658 [Choiromyces venosus 120613-1]|uniref:Uncharacterized protein n=1 Tax=Choiromyces venosus 120613-1 TaxID=1336337 RepID=A0A3N4JI71_9PEZI|nr:hypothetical protein L873DRAFT_1790658 [Choiromyces venosus 120613-1]
MIFNTVTFAALFATAVSGLVVTPTGDANVLAQAVLGASPGIKLVSASYAGAPDGSGTYTDGPQGIRNSAVLTSGNAVDTVIGPTTSGDIDKSKGTAGSSLCSGLANGAPSFDGAVLTMNVELLPGFTGFFSEFVFATEEYPEWIGSAFNDVMGIYVDGKQIAFDETGAPITINGPFFKSDKVLLPPGSGSSFDGSTPILKSGQTATVGIHKIEIAICDISDSIRDSAVFVTLGACTGECKEGTTVAPCTGRGGDSDNDGICNDVDNCPNVFNPDQNPAACAPLGTAPHGTGMGVIGTGTGGSGPSVTAAPIYGNTTTVVGGNTAVVTPPCVTLTSMVTKTITTCTQKTVCNPTVTVVPVTYTSTLSLTVTTPCSTFTVTKCPGGPGSPCHTFTNTVTLPPLTTWTNPAVVTSTYKCPGGPNCPVAQSTTVTTVSMCPGGTGCAVPSVSTVTYKCPGGPYCPESVSTTYTCPGGPNCPVATAPAGCPGGANCPPPAVTTSVAGCPGGPNCPVATVPAGCPGGANCPPPAVTTSVAGCPGGPGCPVVSGSGNKTTPNVPQFTGAAGRVGAGAVGVVGAVGAFAVLLL